MKRGTPPVKPVFNRTAKPLKPAAKPAFNKAAAKPSTVKANQPKPAPKPPGMKGGPGTGPSAPTPKQQWANKRAQQMSKGGGYKIGQRQAITNKFNQKAQIKR